MAELLVKARKEWTHPDPDVDRRGVYRKGDPVVVKPDGHPWGAEEGPPKFIVLRVTGVTLDDIETLLQESRAFEEWRTRYTLPDSVVDAALDGDGTIEVDATSFSGDLVDRATI